MDLPLRPDEAAQRNVIRVTFCPQNALGAREASGKPAELLNPKNFGGYFWTRTWHAALRQGEPGGQRVAERPRFVRRLERRHLADHPPPRVARGALVRRAPLVNE
jgi:hypothetical protein